MTADPRHNLGRFVAALDPGPRDGAAVLVTAERIVGAPTFDTDGHPRFPNDMVVQEARELKRGTWLDKVEWVTKQLTRPLLAGDVQLMVNDTTTDAVTRLLCAQNRVEGVNWVRLGSSDDARNHLVTERTLVEGVVRALYTRRVRVPEGHGQAAAIGWALEQREPLQVGMQTALALAVWLWSRSNVSDSPVVTRRPEPAQRIAAETVVRDNRERARLVAERRDREQYEHDLEGTHNPFRDDDMPGHGPGEF